MSKDVLEVLADLIETHADNLDGVHALIFLEDVQDALSDPVQRAKLDESVSHFHSEIMYRLKEDDSGAYGLTDRERNPTLR